MACELPAKLGLPLSRFSRAELRRHALALGIVAEISGVTIWRWLREDAIRPWTRRSWVFPTDPHFTEKAGRVVDLYHRRWNGSRLGPRDFVICADEKTQIQIRSRAHPLTPPAPGRPTRVESEYKRHGTCAYLAAWDVHRAALFGRVVERASIEAFDALVSQVMRRSPYRHARRVFWIVDNGTIHRGDHAIRRLRARWPNLVLVHLPLHASWLNQIEIYFSILQRKARSPDDFPTHEAVAQRILAFQQHYQAIAQPFEWRFTRSDLARVMKHSYQRRPRGAAA